MARRPRTEMIAETRAKLLGAARHAFGTVGYADASMDELTAAVGLTRGALYHHFGDKKGLLRAVISEIDDEMNERLRIVANSAADAWTGFRDECTAYIEMALEPEIQRIVLRDGPAVLGDPWNWPTQSACIRSMTSSLETLVADRILRAIDPEAAARLIAGATLHAAQWIAHADNPQTASQRAIAAFDAMLDGLLLRAATAD